MEPVDDKAQFVDQEPPKIKVQRSAGSRKHRIKKHKKKLTLKRRKTT